MTFNEHINVAIAVAMPDGGLITPVLQDADRTDIYQVGRGRYRQVVVGAGRYRLVEAGSVRWCVRCVHWCVCALGFGAQGFGIGVWGSGIWYWGLGPWVLVLGWITYACFVCRV